MAGLGDYPFEVPKGYVGWGHKGRWAEADLMEGSYIRCLAAEVESPGRFYLNLYPNWEQLENFMAGLQRWVSAELLPNRRKRLESAVQWDCLCPGLYLLCLYEKEWHRALVTHINPANQENATVELIDYGTQITTPLNNLRYILQGMLDSFPAQGVKCRLHFDPPYDAYLKQAHTQWSKQNRNHLFNLLHERFLGVTFRKREVQPMDYDPTTFRGTWWVSVSVMAHVPGKHKPLDLSRARRDELLKRVKSKADLAREQRFFGVDPSLVKHPDGSFATMPQQNLSDVSLQFLAYIEKPALSPIPEELEEDEED